MQHDIQELAVFMAIFQIKIEELNNEGRLATLSDD